jgi:hypothetical protein
MYSHKTPLRIDDLINTIAFPVEIVEYALLKSAAIEDGDIEPLYIPDKNSKVLSRITISAMIDYCDRSIQFRILESNDIITIYKSVSEYNTELEKYREIPEANAYLKKAQHFKRILQQSINILSKTNPDAKALVISDSLMDIFKSPINLSGGVS